MRTIKAAAALKHMIQLRLDTLRCVEDDGTRILAREVKWHATDEGGRNWDMRGYYGPVDYGSEVRLIVDRLRREYLLEERG